MYILGVNAFIHDSTAALLHDGALVAAAEEERFTRNKHTEVWPSNAIRYCCEAAGIGPGDIDHVAFFWQPWKGLVRGAAFSLERLVRQRGPAEDEPDGEGLGGRVRMVRDMFEVKRHLAATFDLLDKEVRAKVHWIPHHVSHGASAFYSAPFDRAAVLSMDDRGERDSTWLGVGDGHRLEELESLPYPHSLGAVYSMVTQFLGFRKDSDEGKVMGLAAYGEPRYLPELREVCRLLPKGLFEVRRPWSQSFWSSEVYFDEALEKLLGEPRRKDEPIERRHEDLAASVQTLAEEVLLHVSRRLHTLTGASALCLAGGVALNSVANGRLRREGPFDDLFVPPAAGDQGTAIGAALYVWHQKLGEPRSWTMTTPFLGPSFGSERCEEAAAASGYHYRREADICDTAAQLLAQGKILGWLSGRMEIGPRALGHRSILAAPSPAEMRDVLNAKVKFREPFRPFAPAVCEEDAARYFTADKPSPYMLEVHDVRPEWHEQLAAITHVDGTARLQTVSRDVSPRLWELLRAYERLSGIPVLLNTSFNLAGDPIVCTPEDALELLPKSELDFVVIEDIVVGRTPPEEWGI